MAASHQSFSATGQQVARDLAPLIPGLPAPRPDRAWSDSRVWVPLPSLPWAGPQRGGGAGGIPKTWPSPTLALGERAWGGWAGGWEKVSPDRLLLSSWDQPRDLGLPAGFPSTGLSQNLL